MEEKHASRWFFRKFIKVVFYFSWFHPVFVGNLLQLLARSSFYECLWRGDEGPWYRSISSLYHSLTWILALHSNLCFARSLRQTEWNTHTRARTHARTYICKYVVSLKIIFSFFWEFLHWRLKFLNFSVNLAPIWLISPLFLKINVISIFYCYKDSVLTVRWEKWKL